MSPPKLQVLLCLCGCLASVRPLQWQEPAPPNILRSSVFFQKFQNMMSAVNSDHGSIPKGNGSYPVGCTDLMFGYTNESTFLRLYYPSEDSSNLHTIWIPNKEYFLGLTKFLGSPRFMDKILNLFYGSKKVPAGWNSPLRTGEKYPLIVFSHGLGAFRTIYAAIGVELASRGFIVAAVEHRDESASATYYFKDEAAAKAEDRTWLYIRPFPKQEEAERVRKDQVQQRAKECSQALSAILDIEHGSLKENVLGLNFDLRQLQGSIDTNKIAVMGHSFGGATAIQVLSEDQRFRCGVVLDPWMFPVDDELSSKVPQPLFFINSAKFQSDEAIKKIKRFYQPGTERKMITIRGSVHQNFADFTFMTGKFIGNHFELKGDIDSHLAMDLTNRASLAFLQKHLGLHNDFNQWDPLVEGDDPNLIKGSSLEAATLSPELHSSLEP